MHVDDALRHWSAWLLTARGRSRSTVGSYLRDMQQFVHLSGLAELSGLDRARVVDWLNALAEREMAPRSRARKLSALKSFVGWAMEYGHLAQDPVTAELATQRGLDLPLDIQGTAFQRRVWTALRAIPAGSTLSYTEVAERIGEPKAVRAVAGACAANKLAVAIPCHRVVRQNGNLSGYRWGIERKRKLLAREMEE